MQPRIGKKPEGFMADGMEERWLSRSGNFNEAKKKTQVRNADDSQCSQKHTWRCRVLPSELPSTAGRLRLHGGHPALLTHQRRGKTSVLPLGITGASALCLLQALSPSSPAWCPRARRATNEIS
ncbi:uncharacterized protein LOC144113528 isoform X1 [Amblyomma americanum]